MNEWINKWAGNYMFKVNNKNLGKDVKYVQY